MSPVGVDIQTPSPQLMKLFRRSRFGLARGSMSLEVGLEALRPCLTFALACSLHLTLAFKGVISQLPAPAAMPPCYDGL